jgi:DNA repair exonuclease SbcCD nuclease subunit
MAVSFVHTADWQLGTGFGRAGEAARVALGEQRFKTVERLGALAEERRADAVLVAGDVFDNPVPADRTIYAAIAAMESFAGPWVLLPGNHDPASAEGVWCRLRRLGAPESLVVALEPVPIVLADGRLAVLPAPLRRRQETADLTAWFDSARTQPGVVRVGLAHGSIPSRLPEEADAKNPIAEDRAARGRLDYLALGDWHGTSRIDARTWYSGTPEPDRAKENDPGNVLFVRIEQPGSTPLVERVPVGHHRWHKLALAVHGREDVAALGKRLRGLEAPLDRHVVELTLEGTIDLAGRAELEGVLGELHARLRDLRIDDARLIAEPSEDDLQRIGGAGFVRTAVTRLLEKAGGEDEEGAAAARLALRILYLECTQSQAGG